MPGYRRFIAYVYEYVQGKKGEGKGFIKVEAREGRCRLQFKLAGVPQTEVRVYGYVRQERRAMGFLLGTGRLGENGAEFELETREEDMGGKGYQLGELGGLLLLGGQGEVYASGWDEQPVRPDLIELPIPPAKGAPDRTGAEPFESARSNIRQEKEEPLERKADIWKKEERLSEKETQEEPEIQWEEGEAQEEPETEWVEEAGEDTEEETERESSLQEEGPEAWEWQGEVQESQQEELSLEEEELEEETADSGPAEMEGQSAALEQPYFEPFIDQEIYQCRKITPADFRILGKRDQGLMNNNFLRYGMKTYGHLLLGKRREDGRYILGVPGFYERQESLMANMFGFPYFKETGSPWVGGKRSGYWYRLIDTPKM